MARWYQEWLETNERTPHEFLAFLLDKLEIDVSFIHQCNEDGIPASGPLVAVANHPLGAVEGIILSHYLLMFRPDLKVVTNKLLLCFPEFSELFIGVDVLSKNRSNKSSLCEMNRHLQNNGALLIFPAGTVGEFNANSRQVEDVSWQHTAAKLALKYGAYCLPIYIQGRNNRSFYLSKQIHKRIRTLLLPRAMMGSGNRPISIHLGRPFKLSDAGVEHVKTATEYLRASCDIIGASNTQNTTVRVEEKIVEAAVPTSLQYLDDYVLLRQRHVVVYSVPFEALGPLGEHLAA
ncbi:MAG: 1-acyl-sn-glycerol-3-phosphate acyltransferase [Methyloprofundus sp.]|nr:1-acyl-sn-glycerol-3-phosphate acyltransferase [Methyloprofundus sp.]